MLWNIQYTLELIISIKVVRMSTNDLHKLADLGIKEKKNIIHLHSLSLIWTQLSMLDLSLWNTHCTLTLSEAYWIGKYNVTVKVETVLVIR